MSQPFIGEIRMFGGSFAPAGWAFCDGQLLAIADNDALFTLIGTTYGGDGQTNFALPNLQSRFPMHQGQGPGLSSRVLAESAGVESVTLTTTQIPTHTHTPLANAVSSGSDSPANSVWGKSAGAKPYVAAAGGVPGAMNAASVSPGGGSQPHDNMHPFLCVSFIISLFGIFPTQN